MDLITFLDKVRILSLVVLKQSDHVAQISFGQIELNIAYNLYSTLLT